MEQILWEKNGLKQTAKEPRLVPEKEDKVSHLTWTELEISERTEFQGA